MRTPKRRDCLQGFACCSAVLANEIARAIFRHDEMRAEMNGMFAHNGVKGHTFIMPKTKTISKRTAAKATKTKAAKLNAEKLKTTRRKVEKPKVAKPRVEKPKAVKAKPLTAEQLQERRSQAARTAALARWSKERPPSKRELRQQLSRIPSSELTVEDYADRPNPELSWAAAILKRGRSGENQRKKAAEIMSRFGVPNSRGKLAAYLKAMPPEQRHELAQRAGRRRWEIWREEQARLQGRDNFRTTG
jgi:hypothetical protein